ncbi:MAG: hypothetical protein Q9166_007249 [cf. Caloplaca sp. 2 TL-2023]
MASDNPLLKALPPVVDYLTYLTILEYNLTLEQLPVLHDILQDTTLTANIGWDLVHLLLPLLPESQLCLQDVAHLGNPREVVLKVTELLEAIVTPHEAGNEADEDDEDLQEQCEDYSQTEDTHSGKQSTITTIPTEYHASNTSPDQDGLSKPRDNPSKVSQFSALLDMLSILHPRIKTKYPSRFLSTSLQAVLPAYATLVMKEEAAEAALKFIKSFAGNKRPRLPPRKSSTQVHSQSTEQQLASAPDPEANEEPLAPEENALQQRLLHSFLTFVSEAYMSTLPTEDDMPALSWSTRLLEQIHPDKNIPGKRTAREAFEGVEILQRRGSTIGQMLALTRDLNLPLSDLRRTIIESGNPVNKDSDNDLPSAASDVALSRLGCLYLLSAGYASAILFHTAPSNEPEQPIESTTFFSLLDNFLGDPSSPTLGTQPSSLIDSLLFLGHHILETAGLGTFFINDPRSESTWTKTLRYLSVLSATTPSAPLRYNAHLLTSNLLHAHPDSLSKLSFMKDTLQHCPYENIKASAVGWLKDEVLRADTTQRGVAISSVEYLSKSARQGSSTDDHDATDADRDGTKEDENVFATPICISTLAPQLFVDPSGMEGEEFKVNEGFFLAVLNFYYFLLSKVGLRERLNLSGAMSELADEVKAEGGWLGLIESKLEELKGEETRGTQEGVGGYSLLEGLVAMCKEKEKEREG